MATHLEPVDFSFSSEAPLHLFWTRWKKVSTPFGDGTLHPGPRSIFRQFLCPRNKTTLFRILKIILTGGRLSRNFWGLANNNTLGARRMRQARTYSWAWPVCPYLLRLRGPLFDCTLYSSNASRNLLRCSYKILILKHTCCFSDTFSTFARERCITKFCFSLLISKNLFLNVVSSSSTLPSILRRSVSKLWRFVLSSRSDVINSRNSGWIVKEVWSTLLHLWAVSRGVR